MKTSDRSVLRYPGGKYRARKIIESFVPSESKNIVSPFFGGGSFELYMTGKNKNVYAIDKFFVLAVFWEQLSKNSKNLAQEIQKYFNNIDSENFKKLQKELIVIDNSKNSDNALDTAAKFFVVNRCSFSGATLSGGFSKESSKTRFTQTIIDKIDQWNNPYLNFQYGDVHQLLKNLPEKTDLLFLDPPYLLEESKNKLYGVSGDMHKDFDHYIFHEQIDKLDTPFILTYNNTEEIKDLWKNYSIKEAEWAYGMNKSKKSSELIITNIEKEALFYDF